MTLYSNQQQNRWFLGIALMLISALYSSSARAVSIRGDVPEQYYFDLATPFNAVGRLNTKRGSITATLVTPTKILTAAHVVDFNADGKLDNSLASYQFLLGTDVDTPDFILNNFASIDINPFWVSSSGLYQYDLAVITLMNPFHNITPLKVSTTNPLGKVGTMVGYGVNGTGNSPFENNFDGKRRAANNIIDFFADKGFGLSIQTDFDSPNENTNTYGSATPLDLEGTTAGGDSGGPLLVELGFEKTVVGVLHGGFNPFGGSSEYGDISFWVTMNDPDNIHFLGDNNVLAVPEPHTLLGTGIALAFSFIFKRKFNRK